MTLCRAVRAEDVIPALRCIAARRIPIRPVWYPLQQMTPYAHSMYFGQGKELDLYRRAFCFKTSDSLTTEELERAVDIMREELSR